MCDILTLKPGVDGCAHGGVWPGITASALDTLEPGVGGCAHGGVWIGITASALDTLDFITLQTALTTSNLYRPQRIVQRHR